MGLGLGLGIQFNSLGGMVSKILTWGKSIPARFWGTTTPEYWGGLDAQAEVHYNRVIADGGVVPAGLGGVNSFFQVVKGVYGTSDINTAISAAYDPHYLGYKLGAGSGTTLGQAAQKLYSVKSTENLLLHSEDFGNAYWVKNNVTITTNSENAPNATATADTLTPNTTSALHFVNTMLTTSSGNQNLSIYAKSNGYNFVCIGENNGTGWAYFDLLNGTVGNTNSVVNTSIQSVGNGWYRCQVTFLSSGGSKGAFVLCDSVNGSLSNFAGNGTSGIYIWGAQLNTGSEALPYTQTTTTTSLLADVVQTTAASQPLLLAHTGENYWFGSGVTGNFVSTPNAAANQIRGNMDFIVYANFTTTNTTFLSKWGDLGGDRQYLFQQNSSRLEFAINVAGIVVYQSTVNNPLVGSIGWARCTRNSSNGNIEFFTSTDAANTPISSINWTKLGATVSGATGDTINSTTQIEVGSWLNGVNNIYTGRIFRATISNSIGGTPVVDFNPSSYNPANSQTSWVSATSETWTINTGTATSGYKGALVDRSIVQLDRTDDSMSVALTSTMQTSLSTNCGFGLVATRFTNTSNNEFIATLGGDFTANNATQVWFQGLTLGVDIATAGTVRTGVTSTGTYTLARRFSYVDNIVYGGTTTQVLNATSSSGVYFNNTTNKPTITSGNFVLGSSGFGRLNGNVFTFVMAIDGTKFNQLNTALRTFNNNFAL